MNTESKELAPIVQIANTLKSPAFRSQLAAAMGVSINDPLVDRFQRVAMRAVQESPEILEADRNSLYLACQAAAQDNLLPDKRDGALVVFSAKDGDRWVKRVQWLRMVGGIRRLAARAGVMVDAQLVHANDDFEYEQGDTPHITHHPPKLGQDRGEIIGCYAIYRRIETGEIIYREVMDREQIDKAKALSKSGDRGPWGRDQWYGEQARKTVVKRGFKSVPLPDNDAATKLHDALDADNDDSDLGDESWRTAITPPPKSDGKPSVLKRITGGKAAEPDESQDADGKLKADNL
jgi:recombination protein RecT